MLLLSQINIRIPTKEVEKRREDKQNLTAILYFLDRGLGIEQVTDWVESELVRNKGLNVSETLCMGNRNFHIRFTNQGDRDQALSRTRLTHLRREFIILKWTPEAEDHQYIPDRYPVWVRFPELTTLQSQWLPELASFLGPVLLPPGRMPKTTQRMCRVCVEWTHGKTPPTSIVAELGKEVARIPVDVTHLPSSCFKCRKHGHIAKTCPGDPLFPQTTGGTNAGEKREQRPPRNAATQQVNKAKTRPPEASKLQEPATVQTANMPPQAQPGIYQPPAMRKQEALRNAKLSPLQDISTELPRPERRPSSGGSKKISRLEIVPTVSQVSPAAVMREQLTIADDGNTSAQRSQGLDQTEVLRSSNLLLRWKDAPKEAPTFQSHKSAGNTEEGTATSPAPALRRWKQASRRKKSVTTEATTEATGAKRKLTSELEYRNKIQRGLGSPDEVIVSSPPESSLVPKQLLPILSSPEIESNTDTTLEKEKGCSEGKLEQQGRRTSQDLIALTGAEDENATDQKAGPRPKKQSAKEFLEALAPKTRGMKTVSTKKRETRARKGAEEGLAEILPQVAPRPCNSAGSPALAEPTTIDDNSTTMRGRAAFSDQ